MIKGNIVIAGIPIESFLEEVDFGDLEAPKTYLGRFYSEDSELVADLAFTIRCCPESVVYELFNFIKIKKGYHSVVHTRIFGTEIYGQVSSEITISDEELDELLLEFTPSCG